MTSKDNDVIGLDPLIRVLFERMPPPGSKWPGGDRMRWFQCLKTAFDLIYGPADIAIDGADDD